MFERFRKSHDRDGGATAVRDRDMERSGAGPSAEPAAAGTGTGDLGDPSRVEHERFSRESAGERDRGVVVDEPHATQADGAVVDDRGEDRFTTGRTAVDADAPATEPPLTRDRAIEDERRAGAPGVATGGAAAAENRAVADDAAAREDRTAVAPAPVPAPAGRERDAGARPAADDGVAEGRAAGLRREAPVLGTDALATMRARQRDRFGGIHWGSDFFGWLCAIGLASLLTALLVGAGVALGVSTTDAQTPGTAQTIGIGGGIALLAVLAISWFCGGYVAGRMARFDGARQGVGVWLWTLLAAIVVAAFAAVGGSQYDIFQRLNLPSIAIGDTTLTAGGAITGAIAIVVTLLFAVIGGKVGERYHRKVDRVATDEYVAER